ncbi:MAG TPA: hypothetical protein VFP97_07850 [Chitinophagaceae bacterium]|nr:hypothetical protein [Chitinophagaceae bacterium]
MEVHHHTHTSDPGLHRGRKKWTHYFWEFLMLFLAVFCGFLAEYTLEHKIEKDRERQFIKSLVDDIKADIAQLNLIIQRRDEKVERLDSLIYLINLPDFADHGNSIYFNAIFTGRLIDIRFTANNGTLQQLKNSGGLRLIRNRAVVDSIAHYDVSVRNLEILGEQEASAAQDFRASAKRIFNSLVLDKMLDENNLATRPPGKPALLDFSRQELQDLNFSVYTIKIIVKGMRRDSRKLLQQANNLLETINKAYHLD